MSKIITGLNISNIETISSSHSRTGTPIIISPRDGGQIIYLDGITVVGNNFYTVDGTDTHIKSNWKLTTDIGGNNIITSALNSTDLVSHKFRNLNLNIGEKYYLHVQYVGSAYGSSNWSDPIMFIAATNESNRGFSLVRSPNDVSTIVTYKSPIDNTTDLQMEVIDAAYRGNKIVFGMFKKDSSLKNYSTIGAHGGWYFNDTKPTVDPTAELTQDFNATTLYNNWSNLKNDSSAKANCDVWMTYTSYTDSTTAADGGPITGVPAVQFARNITADGGGWQLPTIYQLMIIFILAEELDDLDPTAAANPTKALGLRANPAGRWVFDGENGAWSSTEYNADRVRYVYSNGLCDHNRKFFGRAVIPIREIEEES